MDIRLRYRSDIVASPIELPSSKSIANRALVINALSAHPAEIGGMAVCDDTQAIVGALEQVSKHLGAGQVVDSDNLIALCAEHLAECETTDTAKAVNSNFYRHGKNPPFYIKNFFYSLEIVGA